MSLFDCDGIKSRQTLTSVEVASEESAVLIVQSYEDETDFRIYFLEHLNLLEDS